MESKSQVVGMDEESSEWLIRVRLSWELSALSCLASLLVGFVRSQ